MQSRMRSHEGYIASLKCQDASDIKIFSFLKLHFYKCSCIKLHGRNFSHIGDDDFAFSVINKV